ncbi:MAG: hypothetical protein N2447_00370 [Thermoanaerobaculum sp.]|nr:hypothetical protein [Thermoanaerobaculum sp.]
MDLPNYSFLLVVVCFWLAYFVVKRQLVVPVLALLEEREQRVTAGREAYTQARATLEEALRARERELAQAAAEAQRERARLRAEGEAKRRQLLEAARAEGHRRLAHFQAELTQQTQAVRQQLHQQTHQLAKELARRLLGRPLA